MSKQVEIYCIQHEGYALAYDKTQNRCIECCRANQKERDQTREGRKKVYDMTGFSKLSQSWLSKPIVMEQVR